MDEQIAQCDEMRFRGVDRTVDHELTLDLGHRKVKLMFLGRGNTAGDLVAYLPAERILLTGDVLVHPFPFATQSYITE
jgi:glyoxylase-like metal-dependent hydrolase (beta-lactamase superfamily II)